MRVKLVPPPHMTCSFRQSEVRQGSISHSGLNLLQQGRGSQGSRYAAAISQGTGEWVRQLEADGRSILQRSTLLPNMSEVTGGVLYDETKSRIVPIMSAWLNRVPESVTAAEPGKRWREPKRRCKKLALWSA